MKKMTPGVLALTMLWIGSSCSTTMPGFGFAHFGESTFADTDDDGLPDTRLRGFSASVGAKLDDVTNSADAPKEFGIPLISQLPTTSFFFKNGADGDVRARRENVLGQEAEPTPNPRAPKLPKADRKMIYTASFGVMVPVVGEAVQKLMARVQELGGYLSRRQDATLTVRIPADKFQTLVEEMPEFGRVVSESLSANDVTSKHTDLTIRLENAEKSRKRLLALLERAEKMEDVIKIEAALRRITTEIEQMLGQLKLLNNQIAFSTITVGFQANAPAAKRAKRRQNSRFPWINRIGVEQDLRRF